jgi:thiol-disulfide isomerase/thioredoxin
MLAISIGPLAFPAQPLVLLVGLWVATLAASRLARGADAGDRPRRAENAVWLAALFGLLAARLAHVAMNAGAYAASPWSILDIRDGGWQPAVGWVVAAAWLAASVLRGRDLRRPVGGAALIGLGVWGAGQGALLLAGGSGIGDPVPRVELTALDDRRGAALPEVVAGRPAVVNLWATWCAPCRVEMPVLAEAQRRHPDVQFVFVNQGETEGVVRDYLQREGLALQGVWLDRGRALGPEVGSVGLPTTIFYDAQGRRVDAHFGVLNAASLQARVEQLRAR